MPKEKPAKTPAPKGPSNALNVCKADDESQALAIARKIIAPSFRHGMVAAQLMKPHFTGNADAPGLGDYADALAERGGKAAKGDLEFASRMLAAQASTLDTIFAESARRMAGNMGEHLGATEIYARIAMKAQANSRATLEALAKLHQPREQTVRHVHVNEGGQAVIADQFHHHAAPTTGGQSNGQSIEQPRATGAIAGTAGGSAGTSPALPSPDALGQGLPIPGGEGQGTVQDARRQGERRA